MNKRLVKPAIVLGLLVLWQLASLIIDNRIIMAGPLDAGKELLQLCQRADFYRSILGTLGRVFCGFVIALVLGYGLAMLSAGRPWLGMVLEPVVNFFKAVPVAAIVVLLLIWFGSQNLAVYISFMVVFPSIYISMREGLAQIPLQLEEMAQVFSMPKKFRYRFIVREAFLPHLRSAMKLSMGMSFKSGIAAEIIGLTKNSIGEQLYLDKVLLNTPGVFAWIVVILLLDYLVEKALLWIFDLLEEKRSHLSLQKAHRAWQKKAQAGKCVPTDILPEQTMRKPPDRKPEQTMRKTPVALPESENGLPEEEKYAVVVAQLEKHYHGKELFKKATLQFEPGKHYCIMGASGCGKTTLFRIICGLTKPDGGNVRISCVPAMQFQEHRLCSGLNAWENIYIANASQDPCRIRDCVGEVLDEKWLDRPVGEYSGGMQRKVAFLRALFNPSPLLLLDEPFTGLDAENRKRLAELLSKYGEGKTVLFSTHDPEEAALLGAEILDLEQL